MRTLISIFHCLSPLHAGIGQGIGTIDLPIAREKSTNIPVVPGSSLKGVLRDLCLDQGVKEAIFGPDTDRASDFAGSVYFSDLILLCLPVQSLQGIFAWVTSPYILQRFQRDLYQDAKVNSLKLPTPRVTDICLSGNTPVLEKKVYLEELDFTAKVCETSTTWAQAIGEKAFPGDTEWQQIFRDRFCVCHDDVFSYLMTQGTQVTARIKMENSKKTVAQGGLWYEEALPVETLLWGLTQIDEPRGGTKEVDAAEELAKLVQQPIQLGGNASVGRGFGWLRLSEVTP